MRSVLNFCHQFSSPDYERALVIRGKVMEFNFSPDLSAEEIIEKMKTSLGMDQDQFEHPTGESKRLICLMARTAKHSNRIDVFDHLRKITPPGTTG